MSAAQATVAESDPAAGRARRRAAVLRALSFRKISAIYVFAVIFAVFALWVPETFLTVAVWRTLLDSQAITALIAVALVIPLAAGAFDLAIGAEVGIASIIVAWALSTLGLPIVPAIILALLAGALIGLLSGLLVVKVRIDSFIATLGVSSVLLAGVAWISGGQQIVDLGAGFQEIATTQILGITLPVFVMLAVAAVCWYVLERTPVGRRIYATGGNIDAARLAGVRTSAVILLSLVACGVLAALAGVLVSARISTGDPTVGPSYLLPAFSAAFLGATQFRDGRFNVWGTVLAVYVLAAGIKGLQLAGAPVWIPDLFNGVALLLAVGLAGWERSTRKSGSPRRPWRKAPGDTPSPTADEQPAPAH